MFDDDLQLLINEPAWQSLLSYYVNCADQSPPRAEGDTGPRWFPRVYLLDNIDSQEMSAIHGQLIAMGWLTFQLEDGTTGLTYRVTSEGRRELARALQYIAENPAENLFETSDSEEREVAA